MVTVKKINGGVLAGSETDSVPSDAGQEEASISALRPASAMSSASSSSIWASIGLLQAAPPEKP